MPIESSAQSLNKGESKINAYHEHEHINVYQNALKALKILATKKETKNIKQN